MVTIMITPNELSSGSPDSDFADAGVVCGGLPPFAGAALGAVFFSGCAAGVAAFFSGCAALTCGFFSGAGGALVGSFFSTAPGVSGLGQWAEPETGTTTCGFQLRNSTDTVLISANNSS